MNLEHVAHNPNRHPFARDLFKAGTAFLFILAVGYYVTGYVIPSNGNQILITAAVIGAYMALNIGANDVANNVGPAVGSKAVSLFGAIIIAAIFEASGAIIAGGDVVGTIKKGIIDPAMIRDANTFIWLMMAALLAAAIWLNIATALNAPVSTTHSIVGGVLGAGIAAGGLGIANWPEFGKIAASWVISPVLGGVIAASFLYLIKRTITYQQDMVGSAQRIVPILIALMTWAFTTYILLKGIKHIFKVDFLTAASIGLAIAIATFFLLTPILNNHPLKRVGSNNGLKVRIRVD
ncbi:inorganic phosphate transporter [Methylomarinum vadi]|uniref:inorganic phosphate transporter n=1 Tax=Methylomarinum vadi TaxID=438855 RepID=UPI0009FC4F35|nr:inorganic phosphate transporter [Methylomarinum vadi]